MAGIGNREASQHRFVYVGDGWEWRCGGFTPHAVRGGFFPGTQPSCHPHFWGARTNQTQHPTTLYNI
jgi:hypothetical protein